MASFIILFTKEKLGKIQENALFLIQKISFIDFSLIKLKMVKHGPSSYRKEKKLIINIIRNILRYLHRVSLFSASDVFAFNIGINQRVNSGSNAGTGDCWTT